MAYPRFNLVIEVLVVSRKSLSYVPGSVKSSFNLVIEVLVVSSVSTRADGAGNSSFNLVIEVLVVSRKRFCQPKSL